MISRFVMSVNVLDMEIVWLVCFLLMCRLFVIGVSRLIGMNLDVISVNVLSDIVSMVFYVVGWFGVVWYLGVEMDCIMEIWVEGVGCEFSCNVWWCCGWLDVCVCCCCVWFVCWWWFVCC